MKRRLFNLLAGLSLLLCIASVTLWAIDTIDPIPVHLLRVGSTGWVLLLNGIQYINAPETTTRSMGFPGWAWEFAGFAFTTDRFRQIAAWIKCPYYAPPLLTAILPIAWLIRRLTASSRELPDCACTTCGYDLRATPDRCPECGTVPAARSP